MSDFDELDEVDRKKRAIAASRENYYEQMRKLHTVWYLNYAPDSDPSRDEVIQTTGPQIQLAFDMGYRLAMKQMQQYIETHMISSGNQSPDNSSNKIANFIEERIEDSFCLNYFNKQYYRKLHDALLRHKQEFQNNIADRNWIEFSKYE